MWIRRLVWILMQCHSSGFQGEWLVFKMHVFVPGSKNMKVLKYHLIFVFYSNAGISPEITFLLQERTARPSTEPRGPGSNLGPQEHWHVMRSYRDRALHWEPSVFHVAGNWLKLNPVFSDAFYVFLLNTGAAFSALFNVRKPLLTCLFAFLVKAPMKIKMLAMLSKHQRENLRTMFPVWEKIKQQTWRAQN